MRRTAAPLLFGSLTFCWLPLDGCAPSLPHARFSPQSADALVPVDFAPPPGRVEKIPKRPARADAWIDGEWIRRRGRWYWLVGRWVTVPAGWTYSPWVVVRAVDGSVFYAPSIWKDATGRAMDAPPALAYATASGEAVFSPEGEAEATGRNLQTAPAPPIKPPPATDAGAPPNPPFEGTFDAGFFADGGLGSFDTVEDASADAADAQRAR